MHKLYLEDIVVAVVVVLVDDEIFTVFYVYLIAGNNYPS